jgi:hypothetical protein
MPKRKDSSSDSSGEIVVNLSSQFLDLETTAAQLASEQEQDSIVANISSVR